MNDVAKRAEVSKSTVSQYINNRFEYMSIETKKKIKQAIDELNYTPNRIAKSLKQKKTSTIGVIVANILHTFSTQVIRAIEDYCNEKNLNVIVCNADDNPEKERMYIETLLAKQVDGIIIFPTGGNVGIYQSLQQRNYPIVFVDRHVKELQISSVLLNNMKASSLAVNHLVEQGYKKIAFLTASLQLNITPRIERLEGYLKALKDHQIQENKSYYGGYKMSEMNLFLKNLTALEEPPDAIICANDIALLETLKYANENNISIPNQLAVIGIDEVNYAEIIKPALTIVKQPAFDMGAKAAEILIQQINDDNQTIEVERFEPELMIRAST